MVWGDPARVAPGSGRRAVNAPTHTPTSATPSPTDRSACDPGTVRAKGRGRRRPRTETWHPQPRRGAQCAGCRRAVRGDCDEEWNGQGEHAPAALLSGRRGPLAAATRGAPSFGPHRTPEQGSRSCFPRFSQRPEPNGEALPAVQNHFALPVGLCTRRRSGYGSIVTAWSRGIAISIGPGAAGTAWDGGRTTGQAGPV